MARPREIDDERLLAAADRILMTGGPEGFTLAKAAGEAGVSAATFIKRFGSKQELFLRLSHRWVDSIDKQLGTCAEPYSSPLKRLCVTALHSYHDLDHPETASMQLATLAIDLQRADMRDLLSAGWTRVRRHLERHARDAIECGELVDCPQPEQLARLIAGALEGGCLAWSVRPSGSLVELLGNDLDALLGAWTAPSVKRPSSRRTRRSR